MDIGGFFNAIRVGDVNSSQDESLEITIRSIFQHKHYATPKQIIIGHILYPLHHTLHHITSYDIQILAG